MPLTMNTRHFAIGPVGRPLLPALFLGVAFQQTLPVPPGTEVAAKLDGVEVQKDMERKCPTLPSTIQVGTGDFSVGIALSEELTAKDPDRDSFPREGFCHYRGLGLAALSLNTPPAPWGGDLFQISPTVEGCDIDLYLKEGHSPTDPLAYGDVDVSWAADHRGIPLFSRWGVHFSIVSVGITFETSASGDLALSESFLDIAMTAEADAHLGGPVFLNGDIEQAFHRSSPACDELLLSPLFECA